MFVCKCCGKWKVEKVPGSLRVKHYGFWVADCKSVKQLEATIAPHGLTLADLKEVD